MTTKEIILSDMAWTYCFRRGDKFVFLNRGGQVIKEFDSYIKCEQYARNNPELIDIKIRKK